MNKIPHSFLTTLQNVLMVLAGCGTGVNVIFYPEDRKEDFMQLFKEICEYDVKETDGTLNRFCGISIESNPLLNGTDIIILAYRDYSKSWTHFGAMVIKQIIKIEKESQENAGCGLCGKELPYGEMANPWQYCKKCECVVYGGKGCEFGHAIISICDSCKDKSETKRNK